MNISRLLSTSLIALVTIIASQATINLQQKTIGNENYYFYKVNDSNETLESIAKQIDISTAEIIKFNPSVVNGLSKKQLLFFPVSYFDKKSNTTSTKITVPESAVTHVVKKGETLYGIGKIYDLTVDQLVAANPGTANGVKEGQEIVIPTSTKATNVDGFIYHTIQPGETEYSVAKSYNTTIEKLIELNPGIYPNHFTQGEVIKVVPNVNKDITISKNITQFRQYVVKKDETFESIAKDNNLNIKDLEDANPDIKKCKKDQVINIPQLARIDETINTSNATTEELKNVYSSQLGKIYNDVRKIDKNTELNIAIVLPFELQNSNPPRQAYLYTDFYKGFVMAVDSLNKNNSKKVNINVLDTEGNLNKTDSILALDVMKQMDIIIAPSEANQLARCNKFGKDNNITVINCFSSKNDDYADNSQVIQLNIPNSNMMAIVNEWMENTFKDYTIVFLEDAENSDNDIYNEFKNYQIGKDAKFHNLKITEAIDSKTLSKYLEPGNNYLFIPSNGRKSFLNKYISAVKDTKSHRFDCEIAMIGMPDYIGYLKDYKESFKAIDTYVFSRFFIANENRASNLNQKFKDKFGTYMINTNPSFALMGFDLGEFVMTTINVKGEINGDAPYYDGTQMDIQLKRTSNWGGLMNSCIELVHFKNDGVSESVIK